MWAASLCSSFVGIQFVQQQSPFASTSQPSQVQGKPRRNLQDVKCVFRAGANVNGEAPVKPELRTCRVCKKMYDPLQNHPRACRYHTAHFGGETKRKFESVYTGGTMSTVGGGEISQYWHCCGVSDQFDPGCEAAPHMSYDD